MKFNEDAPWMSASCTTGKKLYSLVATDVWMQTLGTNLYLQGVVQYRIAGHSKCYPSMLVAASDSVRTLLDQ